MRIGMIVLVQIGLFSHVASSSRVLDKCGARADGEGP
jgi:hypothetical protein